MTLLHLDVLYALFIIQIKKLQIYELSQICRKNKYNICIYLQ